jgi:protoporphyrinogen oxidase
VTTSRIVVLGAGLTGLSAASHLPANQTVVVEREAEVGGLCASRQVGDFVFDSTGHVLHLREPDNQELVQSLLPDAFARFERKSRIYSSGVYTAYPFQANTHGLPAAAVRECVLGFLEAHRRQGQGPPPSDFRQWLLNTFGEGIARHFMLPYNERV